MMIGLISFTLVFTIITPLAANASSTDSSGTPPATAKAFISMIFVFNLVFSFTIGPLQILHIMEVLKFETRAKSLGVIILIGIPIGFYNNYVTNLGLSEITWRYYMVFIFWNLFAAAVVYFTFVETTGRTLEELTEIFQAQHPVKTSLSRSKVIIDGEDIILYDTASMEVPTRW